MQTPMGIILKIGDKWREVDPRGPTRVVIVTGFDTCCGETRVRLNGRTWAKLSRFNGKRSGYAPVEKPPEPEF